MSHMGNFYWRLRCSPPFPQGMQRSVLRVLLAVWLLAALAPAFTPCVHAETQSAEKGPPAYTPVTKEELLTLLQRGQVVEGRVITGADIIAILKETDVKIKISHSVIEGGLDFTALPLTPVDKVTLPQDWNDKQRVVLQIWLS